MKPPIKFYSKAQSHWEFSNFYPSPFKVGAITYPTVEHYFQEQKFTDPHVRGMIRNAVSPSAAKREAYRWKNFRADWDYIKEGVMRFALMKKFMSSDELFDLLVNTSGAELIEDSPIDWYWGCGADGTGQNRLGVLLMELRDRLLGNCID